MSSHATSRAMTASAPHVDAPAKTSNNAKTSKDRQTAGRASNNKGKSKKRQTAHHTVDAMPDPRAPKKARSGYELFLLAGGVELHAGNFINKKVDLKAFKRLNDEWQRMTDNDRTKWAGQGVLDRIRFAAEMEMYHGSGTVQAMSNAFTPQLTKQDAKKMKEREDKAKHIAACTFLQVVEMKKRQTMTAVVSPAPGLVALPPAASSTTTTATCTATDVPATATDISTIATPVSSNKSGDPKDYDSTTAAPPLRELTSDSSFSEIDPDEVFI